MRNSVHRLNFNTTIHVLAMLLVFGVTPQQAQGASDADGDFGFAEHLIRDEMYDLAAQQLQLFIENHPASEHTPDAFLLLADAYIKREESSRAADTFQGFTIILERLQTSSSSMPLGTQLPCTQTSTHSTLPINK